MLKNKLKILAAFLIGSIGIFSFLQGFKSFAIDRLDNNTNMPPEGVTCYEPMPINYQDHQLEELNKQLDELELLYKDQKITEEAYKTRKADLEEQINNLEK